MAKFRLRVKRSSHTPKPPNGSSSNNPKTTKYRNLARAQRIANICPHIAAEEGIKNENPEEILIKQLALDQMTINDKKQKNTKATEHKIQYTNTKAISHVEEKKMSTTVYGKNLYEQFTLLELWCKPIDNIKATKLADILDAMCSTAAIDDLQMVFDTITPWFNNSKSNANVQKKAYRILAQIYQRINEPKLKQFFNVKQTFVMQLVQLGASNLDKSAFKWRIAFFRNMIDSFTKFDSLLNFCKLIVEEVVIFMDKENSTPTRHQAANCFLEISQELLRLWTLEGITSENPLNFLFTRLINIIKFATAEEENNAKHLQCALVALNILSQKHIRHMDATHIFQLIKHSSDLLQSNDPQCRVLAIRLMRTICAKMQPFMFEQYKELILTAIFSQPIKDKNTVRIRKSNALLLNLLLDQLGIDTMLKFAGDHKFIWTKMLKNLEKMRRRRQRRKEIMEAAVGNETAKTLASLPSTVKGKRAAPSTTSIGATSAISTLISSLGVKTANADSIFNIFDDNSDDEGSKQSEIQRTKGKHARQSKPSKLSLVIEEDEDDVVDLLDHELLKNKVSIVNQNDWNRNKMKRKLGDDNQQIMDQSSGPFPTNKEGKLLIINLDVQKPKKRKKQLLIEEEETEDLKGKPKKSTNSKESGEFEI